MNILRGFLKQNHGKNSLFFWHLDFDVFYNLYFSPSPTYYAANSSRTVGKIYSCFNIKILMFLQPLLKLSPMYKAAAYSAEQNHG